MSRRSKMLIILLLVLTAAVIAFALFFMGRGVETTPVTLPSPGQGSFLSGRRARTPPPGACRGNKLASAAQMGYDRRITIPLI